MIPASLCVLPSPLLLLHLHDFASHTITTHCHLPHFSSPTLWSDTPLCQRRNRGCTEKSVSAIFFSPSSALLTHPPWSPARRAPDAQLSPPHQPSYQPVLSSNFSSCSPPLLPLLCSITPYRGHMFSSSPHLSPLSASNNIVSSQQATTPRGRCCTIPCSLEESTPCSPPATPKIRAVPLHRFPLSGPPPNLD